MATVREALNKISELRSRSAVLHELVVYLETHYKSSDAGTAELRITRDDYAAVPEEHIDLQIVYLSEEMDQIHAELEEWEALTISADEEKQPTKKLLAKKRKTARGTQSQREDQPAAEPDGQEGSGQTA